MVSLPFIYHLVPMLRIHGASLPRTLQALPLPVSHLQKSALSCRSVIPPYTHIASSCSMDECLWRAGGRSPWQPALEDLPHVPMLGDDSKCHDSVSAGINQPIYLIPWAIHTYIKLIRKSFFSPLGISQLYIFLPLLSGKGSAVA